MKKILFCGLGIFWDGQISIRCREDKTLNDVISITTVNRKEISECTEFSFLKNEEHTPAVIQRFAVYL